MVADQSMEAPIKVFSLQTCTHCKAVKNILQKQQIPFRIIYVDMLTGEERNKILRQLKNLNPACSFPTIVVGSETLVGFKEEKLLQMLASLQSET